MTRVTLGLLDEAPFLNDGDLVLVVVPMVESGDNDGSIWQVHHRTGAERGDHLTGAKFGRVHGLGVQSLRVLTPSSTLGSTSRMERLARNFRRTAGKF